MEVFICTLASGLQSLAPERGQDQGDAPKTKNNLNKNKKSLLDNNLTNNQQLTIANSVWVGVLVACLILAGSFWNLPKAKAADAASNVELAKKVIKEVAPIIADEHIVDVEGAALTPKAKDYIEKPLVVETQITSVATKQKAAKKLSSDSYGIHYFPYGYCTYYVSQKRTITWSGNAGTWLKGAKSAGLKTGEEAQTGAIMVTNEGGTGHVAYVEAVNGGQVTISEMNFRGYGIVSSRTIAVNSRFIKGYIY